MADLVLSSGQQEAHDMVGTFLAQRDCLVARITGYAGTGKTTLIRVLSESYGDPVILTPTGKAALRVHEATGLPASTIHRFLYDAREDEKGKLVFDLKTSWSEEVGDMSGKLVLIDEASMVGEDVWNDLCTVARVVGFHILLMGDLFQLPPVYRDHEGHLFSTLNVETPFSVNLTEVIRQALDSPIIRASMILRSGRPEFEAMRLLTPVGGGRLIEEVIETRRRGGCTISFTNARRHNINARVRAALGYDSDSVEVGEPLLVTQNNYRLNRYNGEVIDFGGWRLNPNDKRPKIVTDRFTNGHLEMRFGVGFVDDSQATLSPEEIVGKSDEAKIGVSTIKRSAKFWYQDNVGYEDDPPSHLNCNYGYVLTCHKSQGSEWPEVLIVIEDCLNMLKGKEKQRWLYTAITRAKATTSYVYVRDER
jgi:exodeoxyribonuclease-5